MSTFSGDIGSNDYFTDSKYGVDVVVKYMNEHIVLLRETESGNQRLCKREEFSNNPERFLPKNE